MAEPERPQPVTSPTAGPAHPHETEEPAVHPHQATDQHDTDHRDTDHRDTDLRDAAVHPDLGADRRDTAVHPDLGTDRRDTAVLPDGGSPWAPPAAPAAGIGSFSGSVSGSGEAPAAGRRSPDLLALTAAAVFCLVAVLGLVGTSLPGWVFGGGFVAVVLVIAGAGLLVDELRRTRT